MATSPRALFVLAVAALLVVPVAISWACGPNRAIQLDRFDYPPGATVTVTGANFFEGASVTITLNGAPVASTTASSGGNLSASFAAPTAAGSYTVGSQGTNPNTGQALEGSGGTQAFTVTAPRAPTTAPSTGGNAPTTGNKAPAPGATPGTQPGTTRQNGRNRTSGREPSRAGARERSGAGRQPSRGGAGTGAGAGTGTGTGTGAVNTSEGVIKTAGRTAFAGSVTRKERATAAAGAKRERGSTGRARPSNSTATADLWSGFASSKNPSLMPSTGDAGVPSARTSTGVAAGLALLGVGLLALLGLGALVAAGRRQGRARAS